MTTSDAQSIVLIISAITVSVTTIMTLFFSLSTAKKAAAIEAKINDVKAVNKEQTGILEEIHTQTNSNLEKLQNKLDKALLEIDYLKDKIK